MLENYNLIMNKVYLEQEKIIKEIFHNRKNLQYKLILFLRKVINKILFKLQEKNNIILI